MEPQAFYVISDYDKLIDKAKTFGQFNLGKEVKRKFRLFLIQHDQSTSFTFTKSPYVFLRKWQSQHPTRKVEKLGISKNIYTSTEATAFKKHLWMLVENVTILNFETKLEALANYQKLKSIHCSLADLIQLIYFLDQNGKLKLPQMKKHEILDNLSQAWTKQIIFNQVYAVRKIYNPQTNQRRKIYRPAPDEFITKAQAMNWFMMTNNQIKFLSKTFVIHDFHFRGIKLNYRDLNHLRINCNLIYKTLKGECKIMDNTHILNVKIDEIHFHRFQDIQAQTKLTRTTLLEQMIDHRSKDPVVNPPSNAEETDRILTEVVRSLNRLNSVTDRQNKMIDLILEKLDTFFEN